MAKALPAVEEGKAELLRVKDKGGNTIQVVSINAASVRPEAQTWTWKNRIPDASITWFVGKPGQGKSLASINVAATVSTGRDWDDGAKNTAGDMPALLTLLGKHPDIALMVCDSITGIWGIPT